MITRCTPNANTKCPKSGNIILEEITLITSPTHSLCLSFIKCGAHDQNRYLTIHGPLHRNNMKLRFYLVKDWEVLMIDSPIEVLKVEPHYTQAMSA